MSKENGFLQLRRGIWEHVRDGSLTPVAALAYIFMLSEADTRTGIWKGSAQCIATTLRIPKSTAKYVLKCLDGRYIRRFSTPGRHSCYPILLHRFVITQGQHVGLMLDAINSANERELEFFQGEELPASSPELVQHVGPQRIKENREERRKKNPAAKTGPPADARHKAAFDACYEAYRMKFGVVPTWSGREAKTLQQFLAEHSGITADEIARRFNHLLASTDRYHAGKHGSLLHLLGKEFDTFADGPVLAAPQKGGSNGKIDPNQRTHDNLRAAGLLN